MPLPSVSKLISEDDVLNRVQDRIKVFADVVSSIPLLDGRLIESQTVGATAVAVPHGLGRPWRGFIVVNRNADVRVWAQTPGADSGALLWLVASGSATVSIWVF